MGEYHEEIFTARRARGRSTVLLVDHRRHVAVARYQHCPEGANCALEREGQIIGRVSETPGGITIKKSKHDITVICKKKGYQDAKFFNKSEVAGATVGNILLCGGIGWAIDSANGADNKYTTSMNITLPKK